MKIRFLSLLLYSCAISAASVRRGAAGALVAIMISTLLVPLSVSAAPDSSPRRTFESIPVPTANRSVLYSVEGPVEIARADGGAPVVGTAGDSLDTGDTVRTGVSGRAAIRFATGIIVRLDERTTVRLAGEGLTPETELISFDGGRAYFFGHDVSSRISTKHFTFGAQSGSEFVVSSSDTDSAVTLLGGSIGARNERGAVDIVAGQSITSAMGGALSIGAAANRSEVLGWTVSSPIAPSDPSLTGVLGEAAILIGAGRFGRAKALLATHERELAEKGEFASLNSLVALFENRKSDADGLSLQAIERAPDSAVAWLARSAVLQTRNKLDEATDAARKAVEIAPDHNAARCRLAELRLSDGDDEEALEHLDAVFTRSPEESCALTLYAFLLLLDDETEVAVYAFERAIRADQSASLPHLGRGLALIKQGSLDAGRIELTQAVALDPNESIYRSYLGKAFFEAGKRENANKEFELAKALDPNDPTPYLYTSFERLADRRPIEAFRELEASRARNDYRAAFRSRLLLDKDEGVRANGLAQAYESLGFLRIAQIEAAKALSADSSNYSAHRLLAQTYRFNPRFARSAPSENTQARLLGPASYNQIAPGASGGTSLNEYVTLFDRPVDRTRVDGSVGGSDRAAGGQIMHAGTTEDLGYLLQVRGGTSDGYRRNDFTRSTLYGASLQYDYSPRDNIVLDATYNLRERGDTSIGIDPDENSPDIDVDNDDISAQLGYGHTFSHSVHSMNLLEYSNTKQFYRDRSYTVPIENVIFVGNEVLDTIPDSADFRTTAHTREEVIRFDRTIAWDGDTVSMILGSGIYGGSIRQAEDGFADRDALGLLENIGSNTSGEQDEKAYQVFDYFTWHVVDDLDVTTGVNFRNQQVSKSPDLPPFVSGEEGESQWTPKFGIMATPFEGLTFRAAYFRSFTGPRTFESRSLEPSLVGGINQRNLDAPGSHAENLGAGLDYSIGENYFGAEYLYRNGESNSRAVTTRFGFTENFELAGSDRIFGSTIAPFEQHLVTSYFYRIINPRLASTLENDTLLEDDEFVRFQRRTSITRAGLNYFHPEGWFGRLTAAWRYQERSTPSPAGPRSSSDFWNIDAGVGYQFEERHGNIAFVVRNLLDQSYTYSPIAIDSSPLPQIGANLVLTLNF